MSDFFKKKVTIGFESVFNFTEDDFLDKIRVRRSQALTRYNVFSIIPYINIQSINPDYSCGNFTSISIGWLFIHIHFIVRGSK